MPPHSAAPPAAGNDNTHVEPRMVGLPADAIPKMHAVARAIRDGAVPVAEALLGELLASTPEHPEALRLYGILHNRCNRPDDAKAVLQRALAQRPDDAQIHNDLGSALLGCGERESAFDSWRRACELAPTEPMPWYNLGRNLQLEGSTGPAVTALQHACTLAPDFLPARILLGDALAHLGRFDEASARYRDALRLHPACGDAWRGLANIKMRPLSDSDREQLSTQLRRADIAEPDRIAMGYALGKVCEDQARYPEAFAVLSEANARMRRMGAWNAATFRDYVSAVIAASEVLPEPLDPNLGSEAIFIVGLPRSGSTLFEQIIATHPQVEGASELSDLGDVLRDESLRRNQAFPRWVAEAGAQDWHRLGRDYLQRTARWRAQRPRFTDKMPENWLFTGVLRAMLPGATIIDTRRDPLEAAWSCFKQQFYRRPHFSCDLADIAAYLQDCARAMDHWQRIAPTRIRTCSYEALLVDPEPQIRELLAFCRLSFEAGCLEFHQSPRSVRTPSASQVRQPLRRDTSRVANYGALLDPLRQALQR
ncbi:tetratricopeptide repeat protein [Luteimonas cucumeris]|uniref:Tetratricopeptide repeat protein n=1 Tax=Luteimonas cucumeris TaxID=985012 RepID=A0A562KZK8_9GAMM|nr:tetratricopeptide repeat-containing sulfotransferase family protein [Luteimonas cucumeris]TWI00859.1 tetratricopeptide repeat protein [Luteimonas cucumeris]